MHIPLPPPSNLHVYGSFDYNFQSILPFQGNIHNIIYSPMDMIDFKPHCPLQFLPEMGSQLIIRIVIQYHVTLNLFRTTFLVST